MARHDPTSAPIIVCPLRFERRALRRSGLLDHCRLQCTGPGPGAISRWAAAGAPSETRDRPVILCGLAGSLRERFAPGSAHVVQAVLAANGERLQPTFGAAPAAAPVLASAADTLTSPEAKKAWGDRSGADLVDRESAAFADLAARHGWRWTIVRGVSDGPAARLPGDIDAWVDQRGRTRVTTICRALARGRVTAAQLIRLRADSAAAMKAAARLLRRMLDDLQVPCA